MRVFVILTFIALMGVFWADVNAQVDVGGDCTGEGDKCVADSTCQGTCKLNVGQACAVDDNKCVDHATCKADSDGSNDGECECTGGYSGTETCIADGQLGGACKTGDVCDAPDTECNTGVTPNVCKCKSGFTEIDNKCVADGQLGGACKTGDVCDAPDTECNTGVSPKVCKCKSGFTETDNKCVADGQLGGACKTGDVCDAPDTECNTGVSPKVCKCKSGFTETDNKCEVGDGGTAAAASLALLLACLVTSRFL